MLRLASLRDARAADVARLPGVLAQRARHVITENARVEQAVACLDNGDVDGLGPILGCSHESLRDDFAVSVVELDVAVAAAVEAGALGARMTGGGFGGSALALVPTDRVEAVTDGVTHAFAAAGFRQPAVFAVQVSRGARRLEVA